MPRRSPRTPTDGLWPKRRGITLYLVVALSGVILGLSALALWLFSMGGSGISVGANSTDAQFAQMHRALVAVHFPSGYKLRRVQDVGAAGILGGDQPPEEIRIYSVTVTNSGRTAHVLHQALVAAGFTADQALGCAFRARRGSVEFSVEYYKTFSPPLSQGAPQCPDASWPRIYAYTVLSLSG